MKVNIPSPGAQGKKSLVNPPSLGRGDYQKISGNCPKAHEKKQGEFAG
jgi:hypothetical protein